MTFGPAYRPDPKSAKADEQGVLNAIDLDDFSNRDDQFLLVIDGFVKIEKRNIYNFKLDRAGDESTLAFNGKTVIGAAGVYTSEKNQCYWPLDAGYTKFRLTYLKREDTKVPNLEMRVNPKSSNFSSISSNMLFHEKNPVE